MRTEDTQESGDPFARARTLQTILGVVVCAFGLVALYLDNVPIALALVGIGGKLMPTGTLFGPKEG